MRSLASPAICASLMRRCACLTPECSPVWGVMSVGQMILHLSGAFRMAHPASTPPLHVASQAPSQTPPQTQTASQTPPQTQTASFTPPQIQTAALTSTPLSEAPALPPSLPPPLLIAPSRHRRAPPSLNSPMARYLAFTAPIPWPHNARTVPSLEALHRPPPAPQDFAAHLADLLLQIRAFSTAPADSLLPTHPYFGPLTRGQWMLWGYRHTDHHLRQFRH